MLSVAVIPENVSAQSFTLTQLSNANVSSPTSIQWGPDGKLYVAQQDGTIQVMTLSEPTPGQFSVTDQSSLTLIKEIPNHNDDGTLAPTEWQGVRQVTGIVITASASDATSPVIYVGSSDPRIGAGEGGTDTNLDTNSGIITRMTYDAATQTWDVVDLVRGLPRSEENHSTNGLQLSGDGQTLYVAQGGHTNAGAPSANFAYSTEYALSAAVLAVDLTAIDALPTQVDGNGRAYKYLLPTLNDPDRADVTGATAGFADPNDPFGGNNGLNQAIVDPSGPVQIYSPGWRNAYDLVQMRNGNLWVVDNGPNPGWGGHPLGESDHPGDPDGDPVGACTNDYDPLEPGSSTTGPGGDPKVNNKDNLHLVGPGYYGGHPTPVRGNLNAGIYVNGTWLQPGDPGMPSDWSSLVPSANPVECDYRQPGVDDGAKATWGGSVNGIAEYLGGDLDGDLVLAGLNGNIHYVDLDVDGTTVLSTSVLASGMTAPLDLTVTGTDSPYPGVVWIATYGNGGAVEALIPDPELICDGLYDNAIDEDRDGYTNADEIDNGTNPCSGADVPTNNDSASEQSLIDSGQATFLLSDLNDPDDDNDGVSDLVDPFQTDADNGLTKGAPIFQDLFLGTIGTSLAGGVGFTGVMTNGVDDYRTMYDPTNLLTGGATGQFSIVETTDGLPDGSLNGLDNGFQFGIAPPGTPFEIDVNIVPNYFNGTPQDGHEQGFYIGTGSQDDYLRLTLASETEFNTLGGTAGGLKVVSESGGVETLSRYPVAGLAGSSEALVLSMVVDPVAGTVQPRYQLGSGSFQLLGSPVAISGSLLDALRGAYQLPNGTDSGIAVGVFASSGGSGVPFQADFESIRVVEQPQTSAATLQITEDVKINSSSFATGSFVIENTSTGGENLTTLRLDLSTSALPDMVFDPNGTAGDIASKAFTPDFNAADVGYVSAQLSDFKNGTDNDDGYYVLEVTFNDFNPGESFAFSIDIDPNSIKGTSAPGPGESGSVTGLELLGSKVTVGFDTGALQSGNLFRGAGSATPSGGFVSIKTGRPAAPTLSVVNGVSPSEPTTDRPLVRVTGPSGATVRLVTLEGALYEPTGGGYQVEPYDVNTVVNIREQLVTLDATGAVDVEVPIAKSIEEGGINVITAAVLDTDGLTVSDVSNSLVLKWNTITQPEALYRINVGNGGYLDANNESWQKDAFFSSGTKYSKSVPIAGTTDPELYVSERWGTFSYDIPVDPGTYTVRLHFAEVYWGLNGRPGGPGQRVFDVTAEGQVVLSQYDILAKTDPATAVIETIEGISVSDGGLTLQFTPTVNQAKVSAIEVISGGDSTPTKYTLATNVQGSGTIAKNPDQSSYTSGTTVELTATPAAGWVFQEWTGDVTSTQNPVSTQVFGNMSVTAVFAEEVVTPEYAVNMTVTGSGTVAKSPDQSTYTEGSTVELTATPVSGWYFTGWSGDATGTTNPLTLTVNAEINVDAAFAPLPTAEAFRATLQIQDAAGRAVTRTFGADGAATAGFDAGLDNQAPPSPPAGAFDARFTSGTTPLYTDIRPSVTHPSTTTWDLDVQGSDAPITITWDPSFLPAGMMTMTTGAGTVNMKTQATAAIGSSPATLTITYAPYDPATQATPTYAASAGWSLWGLPYDVGGTPYETVLPLATPGSLTGFTGTYETLSALALGRGQWVNFSASGDQTFDGFPVTSITLNLVTGWNLVSGPNCSAAVPSSIATAYAYQNGSYTLVTTTEPFQGVWMLASTPETVTLDCTTSSLLASKQNTQADRPTVDPVATITIRDANGAGQTLFVSRPVDDAVMSAFAMPPVPPKDAFDARFEGDSRLAVETSSRIRLQSSAYPLTVHVEGNLDGTRIKSEIAGESVSEWGVMSGQTFQITDPSVDVLSFEMSDYALEELPDAFSLKYNYPNPFRDATSLVFDLPEPADIDVEVYNVLGQRVMTVERAGLTPRPDQAIMINGSNLSAGIYFYRITARLSNRTVTDTGKMVILR